MLTTVNLRSANGMNVADSQGRCIIVLRSIIIAREVGDTVGLYPAHFERLLASQPTPTSIG